MKSKASALTTKPAEMSNEVRSMIDLRHSADQRGRYSPLGRLWQLSTPNGIIQFPVENGDCSGPDLAVAVDYQPKRLSTPDHPVSAQVLATRSEPDVILVLGQWFDLPALRKNSTFPCPKCRHACDICDGSGKKQCEGVACGGRGTVPGPGELCPAPNCSAAIGKLKPECEKCGGSGWYAGLIPCPMCLGLGKMTCSRCRGTGRFATGRVNGSTDWTLPKCKGCDGTGWKGSLVKQDLAKFTNAELEDKNFKGDRRRRIGARWMAIGPILNFIVQDFTTNRPRSFDVQRDDKGDLLFLLVPASLRQKPQKAYLVGGVVRERTTASNVA